MMGEIIPILKKNKNGGLQFSPYKRTRKKKFKNSENHKVSFKRKKINEKE